MTDDVKEMLADLTGMAEEFEHDSKDKIRIWIAHGANKKMAKWVAEMFLDIAQESNEDRAEVEEPDEGLPF